MDRFNIGENYQDTFDPEIMLDVNLFRAYEI